MFYAVVAGGQRGLRGERGGSAAPLSQLSAQTEILDERAVPGDVLAGEILQQPPTAADEQQQAGSRTNVVNVYIEHLRRKIELPGLVPLLRTVRGSGFALLENPS